jgi:hypothetical protein
MSVQFISNININRQSWDACIATAVNGLIYARSIYLDSMAPGWDALVLNDYEAVMPITWRKKYFITYAYQPAFTQQLGIFFTKEIDTTIYHLFFQKLQQQIPFAEINFNYLNNNQLPATYCTPRNNYILPLQQEYAAIYKNYQGGFIKNLKRANTFNFNYTQADNFNLIIDLYIKLYSNRITNLSPAIVAAFKKLCVTLQQGNNIVARVVKNNNDEICAAMLLLKDERRLYNIISCVTAAGRNQEANYFLYDKIVQEFCNSNMVFDLEGSDIKGIADFYKQLGAVKEPYVFLKYNNLHPLIKLIKQ